MLTALTSTIIYGFKYIFDQWLISALKCCCVKNPKSKDHNGKLALRLQELIRRVAISCNKVYIFRTSTLSMFQYEMIRIHLIIAIFINCIRIEVFVVWHVVCQLATSGLKPRPRNIFYIKHSSQMPGQQILKKI